MMISPDYRKGIWLYAFSFWEIRFSVFQPSKSVRKEVFNISWSILLQFLEDNEYLSPVFSWIVGGSNKQTAEIFARQRNSNTCFSPTRRYFIFSRYCIVIPRCLKRRFYPCYKKKHLNSYPTYSEPMWIDKHFSRIFMIKRIFDLHYFQ